MLKQYKWKLLITSLVTILPIFAGILLWSRLPEQIATHFGVNGQADGWSSKAFAVFALPSILLGAHLFCIILTATDPKQKNIGRKPIGLLFWIMPVVSLVMNAALYAYALGIGISITFICISLLGILQIFLGNFLPKVQQNYTFGYKLPWTLNDTENWNRTHRVAGWCMVGSGILLIATALMKNIYVILVSLILTALVPAVYSYLYDQRHRQGQ